VCVLCAVRIDVAAVWLRDAVNSGSHVKVDCCSDRSREHMFAQPLRRKLQISWMVAALWNCLKLGYLPGTVKMPNSTTDVRILPC
jgi:hypothetical protein